MTDPAGKLLCDEFAELRRRVPHAFFELAHPDGVTLSYVLPVRHAVCAACDGMGDVPEPAAPPVDGDLFAAAPPPAPGGANGWLRAECLACDGKRVTTRVDESSLGARQRAVLVLLREAAARRAAIDGTPVPVALRAD